VVDGGGGGGGGGGGRLLRPPRTANRPHTKILNKKKSYVLN